MVGWIPHDPALRKEKLAIFLERVEHSQVFGLDDVPLILQYDERDADMRAWAWPTEGGIPVRPDQLDRHRYTHYFRAPNCPCSFKNGPSSFNEAKIGLAQVVRPGSPLCLGQYVAACATQQCNYFGRVSILRLERYFSHPKLITKEYEKRDKPVKTLNPFVFITDDTEETIKRTGLRQVEVLKDNSNTGLRGTNRLLKREDPENYLKLQDMMKRLLVKGLPADQFWDLFVQCMDCRFVMPRQYFPYYHHCVVQVVHRQLGLPKVIPPPKEVEEMIDDIMNRDSDHIPDITSDDDDFFLQNGSLFPLRVDPNAELKTPDHPTSLASPFKFSLSQTPSDPRTPRPFCSPALCGVPVARRSQLRLGELVVSFARSLEVELNSEPMWPVA
ncbi:hypothetical protein NMY22_g15392 [Coprinellus aureogranulatus]|nr:hypothetical protein NMY22_g15392 [Coprinellus aureogranulatus]